jgi:hypothetical protein
MKFKRGTDQRMIIVRKNKVPPTSIMDKAFNVYLVLPDGNEHEIQGVSAVKRDKVLNYELYHQYTVELVIDDQAVKFE